MTALIRPGQHVSEAHAAWSFWEVRCGACRYGAEQLKRFQAWIECRICGQVTDVIWPPEAMVHGVERLLMMRPDPTTRNWYPGETLGDLMMENGTHGIFDKFEHLAVTPGESLFSVDDDRIRRDKLPALKPRIRQEIAS
jgi:ribosomal protein S27E